MRCLLLCEKDIWKSDRLLCSLKSKDDASIGRKRGRLPEPSSEGANEADSNGLAFKRSKESSKLLHMEPTQSVDLVTSEQSTVIETSEGGHSKESAPKTVQGGNSFPERLFVIMNSGEFEEAIRWSGDGKSFGLIPRPFIQTVLKKEFQGTKLESFQRKLSRWQFSRCLNESFPPEAIVYRHDLFRQDKPELVRRLVSNKKIEISAKKREKKLKEKMSSLTKRASSDNTVDSKSVTAQDQIAFSSNNMNVETAIKTPAHDTIAYHLQQHENLQRGVESLSPVSALRQTGMLPETTSFRTVSASLDQTRSSLIGQLITSNGTSPFDGFLSTDMVSNSGLRTLASSNSGHAPLGATLHSILSSSLQGQRLAHDSILQRAALAAAFERPPTGLPGSMCPEELILRAQQIRQRNAGEESRRLVAAQHNLAFSLMPSAHLMPIQGTGTLNENATLLELYLRQLSRRGSS